MLVHVIEYGLGGYDPEAPDGNVVAEYDVELDDAGDELEPPAPRSQRSGARKGARR